MEYKTRQIVTVLILLGMAVLMGFVVGLFQDGVTGASVFGEVCEVNADCSDGVECTRDSCKNAGTSNAFCTNSPVDYCLSDDGCCPRGCAVENDNDCR